MRIEQIFNGLESLAQLCHNQSITAKTKYAHDLWDDMDSVATEALALLKTHPEVQPNEPMTQKTCYYVMPSGVYEAVKQSFPCWCGVLVPDGRGLVCVKKAKRRDRSRPLGEMLLMMWRSSRREVVKVRRQKNG